MIFLNLIWLQNLLSLREVRNICNVGISVRKQFFSKIGPVRLDCTPIIWFDHSAAMNFSQDSLTKTLFHFVQLPDAAEDPNSFIQMRTHITPQIPPIFQKHIRWIQVVGVSAEDASIYSYLPCFIYEEIRNIFVKDYKNICLKMEGHLENLNRDSASLGDVPYGSLSPYPMVQLTSCYLKILILRFFPGCYIDIGDAFTGIRCLPNISDIPHPHVVTTGYTGVRFEDWFIFILNHPTYLRNFLSFLNASREVYPPTTQLSNIQNWENIHAYISGIRKHISEKIGQMIKTGQFEQISSTDRVVDLWLQWIAQFNVNALDLEFFLNNIMSKNFYVAFTSLTSRTIQNINEIEIVKENFRYFQMCFEDLSVNQRRFSFSSPGLGAMQYLHWLLFRRDCPETNSAIFQKAIQDEMKRKYHI